MGGLELDLHGFGFFPASTADGRGALFCKFGALPLTNASFVSSSLLRCAAPASPQPQTVQLSVVALGDVVTMRPLESTPFAFTFYANAPPIVTALSPTFGDLVFPPAAIELTGRGFAPLGAPLTCAFGDDHSVRTAATFVSATTLRCAAPDRLPIGSSSVAASLDGLAFSSPSAAVSYLTYDSRMPPTVLSEVPVWGDIAGGALITVRGSNVAPTARLACVFDEVGSAAATMVDAASVSCVAPATALPHTTQLRLTSDGLLLSPSSSAFTFHDPAAGPTLSALVPMYGDSSTTTTLTVYGKNFAPNEEQARASTGRKHRWQA